LLVCDEPGRIELGWLLLQWVLNGFSGIPAPA